MTFVETTVHGTRSLTEHGMELPDRAGTWSLTACETRFTMDDLVGAPPEPGHEPAAGSARPVDAADGTAADGTTTDGTTTDGSDVAVPAGQAPSVTMRGVDAAQHAQELLAEHVPLALLVDLLVPTGDTSDDLLAAEGLPEHAWWAPPTDAEAREA